VLVDLPRPADTERVKFIVEGDSIYANHRGPFPDVMTAAERAQMAKFHLWTRAQKGVYIAYGLENYITTFLGLRCPLETEARCLFDRAYALRIAGDDVGADAARDAFIALPSDHGRADSLEQILEKGKPFLDSPRSYVLETSLYDNTDEKAYKAGPYIGIVGRAADPDGEDGPGPDEVIHYSWIQVTNPDGTPLA
jgi:hypothetical protein